MDGLYLGGFRAPGTLAMQTIKRTAANQDPMTHRGPKADTEFETTGDQSEEGDEQCNAIKHCQNELNWSILFKKKKRKEKGSSKSHTATAFGHTLK